MEHILIIGATGQIGSELTMELRKRYGNANVVAGYIPGAEPKGELKESGPSAIADVTDGEAITSVVKEYHIDTIYNLAALLSVVAESKPKLAWKIGIDGLWNVLEVAREQGCAVFTPSSIGSFGASTPHTKTPQDTIQRPRTMYGVTKVTTELLSDYYFNKYGVDTRAVRFPGIISNVTPPGGGTTDYAVDIYYSAVKGEKFVCPIKQGTLMDMMYMPDALNAAITLMEAESERLIHRNAFNIASMSFDPETIYQAIKKHVPQFEMIYDIDPLKQRIADSWPDSLDAWKAGNPIRSTKFDGGYVEAGYLIMGNRYTYNDEYGLLDGMNEKNSLEIVARYSIVNLNDINKGDFFLIGKHVFYPAPPKGFIYAERQQSIHAYF